MAERKVFHDSVVPLPDQPGLTAAGVFQHESKPDDTERMAVEFVLGASQERQDALEAKVAEGQVVAPEELKDLDVPEASVSALTDWLKQQGFDVDHVSDDGTAVYASAPLKVIASSLAVGIVKVTKEGMTYASAKDAPSLPSDVAGDVQAIIGLQPQRQLRKHLRRGVLAPAAVGASTPASRPHGYLVSDILGAYDATGVQATGASQTIAILIDTLPDDGDLQAFWAANGIPNNLARITKIQVGSGPLPPLSGEESLDVQWASGIAPGAKIRIYASGSLTFPALDRALDAIVADATTDPTLRQLSISLGLGETFFGTASDEFRTQHRKFLKLAAFGVNVFLSSGDAGSNPDPTGHGSTGPTQVEYEASDPAVVAVGGTTLHLNANGTVAGETGWSGSGGGKSLVFARPPWQTGSSVLPGPQRLVPDVSLAADPHTGGMVVLNGQPQAVGGTSWSAPVWAGFCARINEALLTAGKPALGFLNPRLYPLAGTAAFRDITSGSNGAFSARLGYDMVTGLGTPSLEKLISALL
jgi:kumamolisin